jgi:hypothetical protein
MRFESKTKEGLAKIKNEFESELNKYLWNKQLNVK